MGLSAAGDASRSGPGTGLAAARQDPDLKPKFYQIWVPELEDTTIVEIYWSADARYPQVPKRRTCVVNMAGRFQKWGQYEISTYMTPFCDRFFVAGNGQLLWYKFLRGTPCKWYQKNWEHLRPLPRKRRIPDACMAIANINHWWRHNQPRGRFQKVGLKPFSGGFPPEWGQRGLVQPLAKRPTGAPHLRRTKGGSKPTPGVFPRLNMSPPKIPVDLCEDSPIMVNESQPISEDEVIIVD